jgi:hypothetical protein
MLFDAICRSLTAAPFRVKMKAAVKSVRPFASQRDFFRAECLAEHVPVHFIAAEVGEQFQLIGTAFRNYDDIFSLARLAGASRDTLDAVSDRLPRRLSWIHIHSVRTTYHRTRTHLALVKDAPHPRSTAGVG